MIKIDIELYEFDDLDGEIQDIVNSIFEKVAKSNKYTFSYLYNKNGKLVGETDSKITIDLYNRDTITELGEE